MNSVEVKSYIASGILEDYALGLVSDQERREVECLSKIYPEIAEQLARIENDLADVAATNFIQPPADLRAKILDNLPDRSPEEQPIVEPIIRRLPVADPNEKKSSPASGFDWKIAASLVLAIGLGFMVAIISSQKTEIESQLIAAQSQNTAKELKLNELQSAVADIQSDLSILRNPDYNSIALNGTDNHPDAKVLVYWNKNTSEVYLDPVKLPSAPEGKQYQLWTIVDGAPVDMGMLSLDPNGHLQKMKASGNAQAFAITVEQVGGSPTPTLETMVVIGQVAS